VATHWQRVTFLGKRRKERVKQKETLVGRDGRRAGRSASRANSPSARAHTAACNGLQPLQDLLSQNC